jgi:hypothetical protein
MHANFIKTVRWHFRLHIAQIHGKAALDADRHRVEHVRPLNEAPVHAQILYIYLKTHMILIVVGFLHTSPQNPPPQAPAKRLLLINLQEKNKIAGAGARGVKPRASVSEGALDVLVQPTHFLSVLLQHDVHHIPNRDHTRHGSLLHHRHVPEPFFYHEFHDVEHAVLGGDRDEFVGRGHDILDTRVARVTALDDDFCEVVAFREDAYHRIFGTLHLAVVGFGGSQLGGVEHQKTPDVGVGHLQNARN